MGDGDTRELKWTAASGVRYTAVASAVTVATGFIQTIVLGRLLGPEAFGLFALVMLYLGFASMVSDGGISEALIQRSRPTRGALDSLYWLNVGLGVSLYALSLAVAPLLAMGFRVPELGRLIVVAALTIPIGAATSQFGVLATKELRFKLIAAIQVARSLSGLIVALVAEVAFDQGVWALVWGALTGSVLSAAAFGVYGLRAFGPPRLRFVRQELRGYLSFGGFRLGARLLNYANTHVDQMMIGVLLGPLALGYYRVAVNLVFQPLHRINPMITQVAFPLFSKIQDDVPRIKRGFLKVVRLLALIDAPIFVGLALVAPAAVPWAMGSEWLPAVPVIQVLVFYGMIRAVPSAAGGVIMAKGRADWTLQWNLGLFVLIPVTILLAARTGDLKTVAWALVGLQAVLWLLHYRFFLRRLLGSFFVEYVQAILPPALLAFGMAGCVLAARALLPATDVVWHLGVEIAVGVAAYASLAWLFLRREVAETLDLALSRR